MALRIVPGGGAAPEISDERLIEAVRSGDARVARALYERLRPTTDRALLSVLGRRETEHEDLVQATFEQVVATLMQERFAGACALKTWAARIATNLAISLLRKRRTEREAMGERGESVLMGEAGDGIDTERRMVARDVARRVRAELARMEPVKAETLVLHDVLGHELTEIALIMGCSVAAAQSRLVRARHELVARVDGEEGRADGAS